MPSSFSAIASSLGRHQALAARWSGRVGFTLIDQAALSGANFLLTILLARTLTPADFGSFSVAFTVFLFLLGFHNALILEPMGVLGAAVEDGHLSGYLREVVWIHLAVSVVLAGVMAVGAAMVTATSLRASLFAAAGMFPLVLLGWTLRRACYLRSRAGTAAASSCMYAALLLLLTWVLAESGGTSPVTAWFVIAAANVASCLIPWRQLGVRLDTGRMRHSMDAIRATAIKHWRYGNWILVTAALALPTQYVQVLVAAWFVDLAAAGELRAAFVFLVPIFQAMAALGSVLALPVMARDASRGDQAALRRKTLLITGAFFIMSVVYAVVLLLVLSPITQVLLDDRTPQVRTLIPILVLCPILTAVGTGCSLALRASQHTAFFPLSSVASAIVGVSSAFVFTSQWGVTGAALSNVLAILATSLVAWYLYTRWIGLGGVPANGQPGSGHSW